MAWLCYLWSQKGQRGSNSSCSYLADTNRHSSSVPSCLYEDRLLAQIFYTEICFCFLFFTVACVIVWMCDCLTPCSCVFMTQHFGRRWIYCIWQAEHDVGRAPTLTLFCPYMMSRTRIRSLLDDMGAAVSFYEEGGRPVQWVQTKTSFQPTHTSTQAWRTQMVSYNQERNSNPEIGRF